MKFVFIFLTSMQAAFSSYSQPNFVNIPIFLFGSWFKFLNYIFFFHFPSNVCRCNKYEKSHVTNGHISKAILWAP